MEIKLDGSVNPELKEYLLSQNGINNVDITYGDFFVKLNIKHNEKTNPSIIMKYIELFENYKYSYLLEFNKNYNGKTKILKYTIDDMCCDHCYMGLVMDLFENDKIKSVKSNFDFNASAYDIEFIIEYDFKYNEDEIIKLLK